MNKNLKLFLLSTFCFTFFVCTIFTSCDFTSSSLASYLENLFFEEETTTLDFSSAATSVNEDDYIYVDSSKTVNFNSSDSGKNVYKIAYNTSTTTPYNSYATTFGGDSKPKQKEKGSISKEIFNNEIASIQEFNNSIAPTLLQNASIRSVARSSSTSYSVGDTRTFYILDSDEKQTSSSATLKYQGNYCNVWFMDNASSVKITDSSTKISDYLSNNSLYEKIAEIFDSIYPVETNLFGSNIPTKSYDNIISVDSNTKIDILLCDIYEDAKNGQEDSGGTFGYFYSLDMITNDYIKNNLATKEALSSNESEMFYVDSYFLCTLADQVYSTLAHEFQHMLHFVNKSINNGVSTSTWFNEMLSMCCEELLQDVLNISDDCTPKARLSYFNLASSYGFADYTWDFLSAKNLSGTYDYAISYAFGTYLMHNYGGATLINKIALNAYADEESITQALSDSGYSESFETTLLKFGQVYINTDSTTDTPTITLNREVSKTVGSYTYTNDAIDLYDEAYSLEFEYSDNESSYYYILSNYCDNFTVDSSSNVGTLKGPAIYKSVQRTTLYPYGFFVIDLGEIGTDIDSITVNLPSSNHVYTFLMIK